MNEIAAILVASDSRSSGERKDLTGAAARETLADLGIGVGQVAIIPDEVDQIAALLEQWAATDNIHLVLTCGGTGLTPRDVTPEATRRVIEREAPGIPELLRAESMKITAHAALSRAVAGVRSRTLIINLPGSPKAVRESIQILAPLLPHALETVTGRAVECAGPRERRRDGSDPKTD